MIEGYIYKITNRTNKKYYIGKTKSHYGISKWSVEKRWKRHINKAYSSNPVEYNECPLFYNAIRKYGDNDFDIEVLIICNLENIDMYEIKFIDIYSSTNRNFGYNIAKGGKGRSVTNFSEDIRAKLSKCKLDDNFELNIRPCHVNNLLVGYRVRRYVEGIEYCKRFANTTYTPEENKLQAQKWLESFKNGVITGTKYNKLSKLPEHIGLRQKNGIPIGYECTIQVNGTRYQKRWQSTKQTMEEKMTKAQEYKQYILDTYVKTIETPSKED